MRHCSGNEEKEEKQYEEKNDQRYPLLFYGSWYAGRMRQQARQAAKRVKHRLHLQQQVKLPRIFPVRS